MTITCLGFFGCYNYNGSILNKSEPFEQKRTISGLIKYLIITITILAI